MSGLAIGGALQGSLEAPVRLEARVVTLTGSGVTDAVRDAQDVLEELLVERGMAVRPVDLQDWSVRRVPDLLRAIRRERPDVILMQYPTAAFGQSFGPIWVNLLQRIAPVVVMLHEFVAAHPLRKLAIGGVTARATFVATTAEREANLLCRYYPWLRSRIRSVPIASVIPSRPWTPVTPRRVIYFGQLRPEKGLEAFFECQAAVLAAAPDVEFHIAGAIVERFAQFAEWVLAQAREKNVTVAQGLASDDVAEWIAKGTVALLPFPDGASFRRGSMMAATASGVPIVTTVGADTPKELRDLVDPAFTVSELSALTIRYLTSEDALQRAHENSVRLSQLHSWDKTVDCYLAVMREAIQRRTSR